MVNCTEIIKENSRRLEVINRPYNPVTGQGSDVIERVPFVVKDFPYPVQFLPLKMYEDLPLCRELKRCKSVSAYLEKNGIEVTRDAIGLFLIKFSKERIIYDFEYFAATCLKIRDKTTKKDVPFVLNRGQRKLLKELERQRMSNLPIRIILLKARQWGGSTLIQLYMFWIQLVHKENWNSCICAHTKDAAKNIRGMFTHALANYPALGGEKLEFKPFERADNIKFIPERGARITVGSAESPNSVRSQDAVMVHYSEVAFFPNTLENKPQELIGSVSSSVARIPYSMICYESTAKGVGNFFHNQWLQAKEGKTAFSAVFVSWFEIDIYSEMIPGDYESFVSSLSDYELSLFDKGATLEGIYWYRLKCAEQPSEVSMKEEFPSDDIEAFQHSGQPAFNVNHIERLRKLCCAPESIGELYGDANCTDAKLNADARRKVISNICFEEDSKGLFCVWSFPDLTERISYRYVVVVDTGGRSVKADYSVICVLDRYWMQFGGKPEIVAQWRGHIDHDVLAWKAVQIAAFYNNALLVFESNTAETESTDGDHSEFIYDTISQYYSNLYSRTPADKIRQGVPLKFGFHMNRSTKPLIIDNYVSILRESGYVERCDEALNEARFYEKKQNGSYGAIDGQHDDILITRMIALQICYELPLPKVMDSSHLLRKPIVGEASI